jgi:hypothetical protein
MQAQQPTNLQVILFALLTAQQKQDVVRKPKLHKI